jgi:hypothetical protein
VLWQTVQRVFINVFPSGAEETSVFLVPGDFAPIQLNNENTIINSDATTQIALIQYFIYILP